MKKSRLFIILLLLLCVLSACDDNGTISDSDIGANIAADSSTDSATNTADAVTQAWNGVGNYYMIESYDMSGNCLSAFSHGADIYSVEMTDNDGKLKYSIIQNSSETIYESTDGGIACSAASEEGIWVVNMTNANGEKDNVFHLLSFDGVEIRSFALSKVFQSDLYALKLICSSEALYLYIEETLVVLTFNGDLITTINLSDVPDGIVCGYGNVYVIYDTEDGEEFYLADIEAKTLKYAMSTDAGTVYDGNDSYFMLLVKDDGLYEIQEDGNLSPIAIWEECGIAFGNLRKIYVLPHNKFLCWDSDIFYMLTPSDPANAVAKTKLVLASIGKDYNLEESISKFNALSDNYYIQVVDYTQDGLYSRDEAILKLNTEILSGNSPDMIIFVHLNPYPYIQKGYMVDLNQYLGSDSEVSGENIAIRNALETEGGVYFIDHTFHISTLMGLSSKFGDSCGWTIDKYLEIESSLPSGSDTLYSITQEEFLAQIAKRYIRTAVDWTAGTCDFYNEDFIKILEASKRIKENPEPAAMSEMDFTYGPARLAKGTLIASGVSIEEVWELAFEEFATGNRLSCIGWPTVDGSCGSDIRINDPIGICSQSASSDGCWEFIKFILTDEDINSDDIPGLPVFMPLLKARINDAVNNPVNIPAYLKAIAYIAQDSTFQLSNEDAERFYTLLSKIDNVEIYDETILTIIDEESGAFFAGEKSAEETAKIIQSRSSIYLAEQSE